tara:strand:- start:66 stop:1436 length:1371 start_codon:yes stop_codon:yes gene_type:complete
MVCDRENKSDLKFQNFKINGNRSLKGQIKISGAKNSSLVLLAASLLSDETITLTNVPNLTDIDKMKNILKSLGVLLKSEGEDLVISPHNLHLCELPYELVNGLRASFFCIGPLLTKLGEATLALPGGCKIGKRPIEEHIKGLKALGAEIIIEDSLVKARINNNEQRLKGTNIKLNCPSVGATETLIMASTLAKGRTIIENAAREPEVQDLCFMLNKMGANIYGAGQSKIIIEGVTKLKGCSHKVIPDRIEAGTFLIAAASTFSSITVSPVIPNHLDSVIEKLRESGSKITINGNSISIKTNSIKAVNIQTAPFPGFPTDLQAPFTALMSIANGQSKISETIFENRMSHIKSLNQMGASIVVEDNTAFINGVQFLNGESLKGQDLRSSAAITIAALAAKGISRIEGLEHLDRGYENFENKLSNIGAEISRENAKNINHESKLSLDKSNKQTKNYQAA